MADLLLGPLQIELTWLSDGLPTRNLYCLAGIGELTNLKELKVYRCRAVKNIPGVLKEKLQAQGCKISNSLFE